MSKSKDIDNIIEDKNEVSVVIDGTNYIFYDKWVKNTKSHKLLQRFGTQTSYTNPKSFNLLIKGYILSKNDPILLIIIVKFLFNKEYELLITSEYKKNIEKLTKYISDIINNERIKMKIDISKEIIDKEIEFIHIIIRKLDQKKLISNRKEISNTLINEIKLYRYKNKKFGVVKCPFKIGEYLPKVKIDGFYIINNLLSYCPNERVLGYNYGWLQKANQFFAWISYIIKYHVNNVDFKTSIKVYNTFCLPTKEFTNPKFEKFPIGWINWKNVSLKSFKKYEQRGLELIISNNIINTIINCKKTNTGVFVTPFLFTDFESDPSPHACVLIINFQTNEILFANPWGIACKEDNCYKLKSYDYTMKVLKIMKNKIYSTIKMPSGRTKKNHFLKDFKIIQFSKCSPVEGPQRNNEPYCTIFSMMIIHLYLLNYKSFSLYQIIEYLNRSSRFKDDDSNVYQYNYLTWKIIPEVVTKDWYKKAGLSVPSLKYNFSSKIDGPLTIYTRDGCPACKNAIILCKKYNIQYEKLLRSDHEKKVNELTNNYKYVPVIFDKNFNFIGGYTELKKLLEN